MFLIRLTGAVFLFAAWLFFRSAHRAGRRGWIGRRYRPVVRERQPVRFRVALTFEWLGLLTCLVAAYLCLTHSVHVF